jgi:hypothetical protein
MKSWYIFILAIILSCTLAHSQSVLNPSEYNFGPLIPDSASHSPHHCIGNNKYGFLIKSLPVEQINIYSEFDIQNKRDLLIDFIWEGSGWPNRKTIDSIEENVFYPQYESLYTPEGNLKQINRYTIKLPFDFISSILHFIPENGNGKLFIYHSGHGYGYGWEDKFVNNEGVNPGFVIPALLKEGYAVLAIAMPLNWNNFPQDTIPGVGIVDWGQGQSKGHDQMFQYLPKPFSYFIEPIVVVLNYINENYSYIEKNMIGLSGGGWTTTLYAALDTTIRFSFPIAGSVPLYLRIGFEGLGDSEQGWSYNGLYGRANYKELYLMGSYGIGRGQLQILNRYDQCCFRGNTRQIQWVDPLRKRLDFLGDKGVFNFYLDESHNKHKISPVALKEVFKFLHYYENGKNKIFSKQPDGIIYSCQNDTIRIKISTYSNNLNLQWQHLVNGAFEDITEDTLFKNTQTEELTILSYKPTIHSDQYRCIVTNTDDIPITYSYTAKIDTILQVQIIENPKSTTRCESSLIDFTIEAKGFRTTYKWQLFEDTAFKDITSSSIFTNSDSATMTIPEADISLNNSLFRCRINDACGNSIFSDTVLLTILPKPALGISYLQKNYCLNNSPKLIVASPEGGILTGKGISNSIFSPDEAGVGLHEIVYTYTDSNQCQGILTKEVIVYPTPEVFLNGLGTSYCIANTTVELFGEPIGGYFTGNGIIDNYFMPDLAGVGIHEITYSYIDTNSCSNSTSIHTNVDECLGMTNKEVSKFVIIPNPSQGAFIIKFNTSTKVYNIEILNQNMSLHSKIDVNDWITFISANAFNPPSGFYFLKVNSDQGTYIEKLIVIN